MKTNEFVSKNRNLGEASEPGQGVGNWLLRHGIAGRTRAAMAQSRYEQYANKEAGFNRFYMQLYQAWQGAKQAEQVKESINSFRNYNDFSFLLEEIITENKSSLDEAIIGKGSALSGPKTIIGKGSALRTGIKPSQRMPQQAARTNPPASTPPASTPPASTDQQTPSEWIKNYVSRYTSGQLLPSNYDSLIGQLANSFEQEVRQNSNSKFEDIARKIYDFLYSISLSQIRDSSGKVISSAKSTSQSSPANKTASDIPADAEKFFKRFNAMLQYYQQNNGDVDELMKRYIKPFVDQYINKNS